MKELFPDLDRWRARHSRIALARVVDVEGSGPRLPGAAMAVSEDGEVAGSVSGGCVEGAVVTEALRILEGEAEPRLVTFGYSDDDAFAVGLTCGGTIHLFVATLDDLGGHSFGAAGYERLRDAVDAERPVAVVTVVEGPGTGRTLLVEPDAETSGSLGDDDLDRVATRDALAELDAGRSGLRRYGARGEARQAEVAVFIEAFAPPPRMVVFGAVDFTAALVKVAKVLGYRVTVCDAREVFATRRRFPQADEIVVDWPHRWLEVHGGGLSQRDAVCVLTHDHKFDVPALVAALSTDAGYIGAMGSRRTHAERTARLQAEDLSDDQLARVHGPIGLDLGARTPEETAVAICAEIIATRTGRAAPSLRDTQGPLH